ncbi:hypothetical protein CHLRE_12g556803v5 [Chlamydomonas reinhardtii]|uniref:Uncharacterized protein n=2 Tax=Chlamydomonas reinhardtii TaxID=3055 RepID=A0A2K3D5R9_CHLRE|nr:uncharacterized protein CHLRE_12g556803v5 [Chlamydomonas reinhardtii]PNW75880.1 hypothetical protein CHLRE_12g556803v5 [Chlamydomonas reinhardtii]
MLNFFIAIPMYLLSQHHLVQQPVQVPFPPPPLPATPTLPTAPAAAIPSRASGRLLLQSGGFDAASPPTNMTVTYQCLWSPDGVSSLCKQTEQVFFITIISAILVFTAWMAGPLTALTQEEGPLRPLMLCITVATVACGAILDLIITIVVGSAAYRMWDAFASVDAAELPGSWYRNEVHGLTVTVAVVSGLSIPLNPSLLMLFTRAVERYVDRRWPSRIPHDDLSRGGRSAQEVLQEEQAKRRLRLQALGAASAPVGAARAATEGAAIRKSGSGHGGAGAGAGPANRSNRSVSRGQAYQI